MTDNIEATVPVTVTLDLHELLQATVGDIPPYSGDPDDEWIHEPLVGEIVGQAASIIAKKLMSDAKGYRTMSKFIRDMIDTKLAEMVDAELNKPYVPVDSYGEKVRGVDPTTLRAQIGTQINEALAKGMSPSSRYGSDPTAGVLKKYIDTEIGNKLQNEFKAAIEKGKKEVLDKIQEKAAAVIAQTIANQK